jgi:hypothetical protein
MKYLKLFNEKLIDMPMFNRGEIVVYANRKNNVDMSTVEDIAKRFGYKVKDKIHDNGYIIECEPGQEKIAGSDFVDNYPEFFDSYEREDIKDTYIINACNDIIEDVDALIDSVGNINEFGRSQLPKDWNDNIERIINKLNNIKID